MTDTVRTKTYLQNAFATNNAGGITAQNARDLIVSMFYTKSLTFVINNSGVSIPANSLSAVLIVPFNATVVGWTIQADQSCTVTTDFFKQSYSTSTQPTSDSWLSSPTLPSLTAAQANESSDFLTSGTGYGAISASDQILCKILTNDFATILTVTLVVASGG